MKVLVLCHGNICRSALVAAIIKKRRPEWDVDSAGLGAKNGAPAAKKMREFAIERSIDLSAHRAKYVEDSHMEWADVVLYMDDGNLKHMKLRFLRFERKFVRLSDFLGHEVTRIPDPNFAKRGPDFDKKAEVAFRAANEFVIAAPEVFR